MITCSSCGAELPSRVCDTCRRHNPADAKYCAYCGVRMVELVSIQASGDKKKDPFDLDNRVLCSDDSCIGIIGPSGVCTVCGRPPEARQVRI